MMQLGTVSNDNDDSTQPMTLHALQQRANSVASGSEYFINPRGKIVSVLDALCKVEIEIWHKWKQETKINI